MSAHCGGVEDDQKKTKKKMKTSEVSRSISCHAYLKVCGSPTGGRSCSIIEEYSTYPLRLISNSNHSCVLGYGGGSVSGDTTNMKIELFDKAFFWVWTQGSTRIYKAVDGKVTTSNHIIHIRNQSMLAMLPDPVCCYDNSNYRTASVFKLDRDSSLVAVSSFSGGRKGRDAVWGISRLQSKSKLFLDDKLVYYDPIDLFVSSAITASIYDKIGGYEVFGSVIIIGPHTSLLRERLAPLKRRQSWQAHLSQHAEQKRSTSGSNGSTSSGRKEPLVGIVELECSLTVVSFVTSNVEDSYFLLRALLAPLHRGYYDNVDIKKVGHDVSAGYLLDAAPYANRLPPSRSTSLSKYGYWHESSVYRLLDQFDATQMMTYP